MSGALAVLAGTAFGTANSAWAVDLADTSISTPGTYTVWVRFNTDGTTSAAGAVSPPDWYVPPIAGVGSTWSVRVTNIDGALTNFGGDTMGAWLSLAASKTFSFANSSTTVEGTGSASVEFSPDGGATIVVAGGITWDVGYIS